jgi:hypothetical protein
MIRASSSQFTDMNMSSIGTLQAALLLGCLAAQGCGGHTLDFGATQDGGAPGAPPPDARGDEGEIVLQHQYGASNLVTDGTRLYWSTSPAPGETAGSVRSCDPTDCAGTVVHYGAGGATWIGVNATRVFWRAQASLDKIYSCPTVGCGAEPDVLALSKDGEYVTVDDTYLYWTSYTSVLRCPVVDCEAGTETVADGAAPVTSKMGMPNALISAGDNLYFATGSVASLNVDIAFMPKSGGLIDWVAFTHQLAGSLAVEQERILWANPDVGGAILACPTSGCTGQPETIAAGQRNPTDVGADERNAYWIDAGDDSVPGDVLECTLTGCDAPKRLAAGQFGQAGGLAALSSYVYWASGGRLVGNPAGDYFDGDLRRAPK